MKLIGDGSFMYGYKGKHVLVTSVFHINITYTYFTDDKYAV